MRLLRSTCLVPVLILGLLFALSGGALTSHVAGAATVAPAVVLPPEAEVDGLSLAEWSARAYQWQFSFPTSLNPSLDATGERCGYGQSGPVFFLANADTSGERLCTIPSGVTIFVPLIGAQCSSVEPPPWFGQNEAELRTCAMENHDSVPSEVLAQIAMTVDGQAVEDLTSYRATTPAFDLNLPPDNLLGVDPGIALAVADGYQVMLVPPAEGEHEIVTSVPGSNGPIIVTYRLLVVASTDPVSGEDQAAPEVASPAAESGTLDEHFDAGGGRMLHVACVGNGAPTVLLEQGGPASIGGTSAVPEVGPIVSQALGVKFCAYDRAGSGESDPHPMGVRTFEEAAADLITVLAIPELDCPCVVVGESLGGAIALVALADDPANFAGLVLLDAPYPGYLDDIAALAPADAPEAMLISDPYYGGENEEQLDLITGFGQIVAPTEPLSIPVVVVTHGAGYPPPCWPEAPCSEEFPVVEFEAAWQAGQADLAESLGGELVVAQGTGHSIAAENPVLVIEQVGHVVASVRDSATVATLFARPTFDSFSLKLTSSRTIRTV